MTSDATLRRLRRKIAKVFHIPPWVLYGGANNGPLLRRSRVRRRGR